MADNILELINEELVSKLKELAKMEIGSAERKAAIAEWDVLFKAKLDHEKLDAEKEDNYQRRLLEQNKQDDDNFNRSNQMKEAKKDRIIRIVTGVLEVVVPSTIYVVLFLIGIKFEETGSITSSFMKNLMSKFKFKK